MSVAKKLFTVALIVICIGQTPGQAFAEPYDDALTAFQAEDFRTASTIALPLAIAEDVDAQVLMGRIEEGADKKSANFTKAAKWFQLAAVQGDHYAQYKLADMHEFGKGVPQSDKLALQWYQAAAEQGYSFAQSRLGSMYSRGRGTQKDAVEAVKWFRAAAAQKNIMGMDNLAFKYYNGDGVPRSYTEAIKWFRLSAREGSVIAQEQLGRMHALGRGVPQDYVNAYVWFSVSASQGYKAAAKFRDDTEEVMTKEQVSIAQGLANRCFMSRFRDCD